jgi:hypothetical protein
MAHFKRGNLQLKTNQQIQLGDSQESLIEYDGSDLLINPSSGVVELYYAGALAVSTRTDGISFPGASDTIDIHRSGEDLWIDNNSHGGRVYIFAEDSGGTNKQVAIFGASANYLFHNGAQTFFTRTGGFYIQK